MLTDALGIKAYEQVRSILQFGRVFKVKSQDCSIIETKVELKMELEGALNTTQDR